MVKNLQPAGGCPSCKRDLFPMKQYETDMTHTHIYNILTYHEYYSLIY